MRPCYNSPFFFQFVFKEKPPSQSETAASHEAVQESIMAVDETINNLIKELKQERKSHHKVRDESGVYVERNMEKINRLANVH